MIHDLVARRTCRLKIRLEEAELSAGADHRSRVHDTHSSSRISRLRLMRRAASVAIAPDSRYRTTQPTPRRAAGPSATNGPKAAPMRPPNAAASSATQYRTWRENRD